LYFKTKRLGVRQLIQNDYDVFDNMQSNRKVMEFTLGRAKTAEVYKENIQSVKLLEKSSLGFVREYEEDNIVIWLYASTKQKLKSR